VHGLLPPQAAAHSAIAEGGRGVSALIFLLVAVVISIVGSALLLLRTRKPHTSKSSIDAFRREMQALAPPFGERQRRS
jgi:hypothetical protein